MSCNNSWGGFETYNKSKLANVMFTVSLAEKLKNTPKIKAMSLHPGVVASDFYSTSKCMACFKCLICCIMVNNETGARTSLYLSRLPFQ